MMGDIDIIVKQIRKISRGMISDAEHDSKNTETVLSNLANVKERMIELRDTLPCTTTGKDYRS